MPGIVRKIKDSGNADKNCNNIVILAEGYTAEMQAQFFSEAQDRIDYFFKDVVFAKLSFKYNAYAIFLPSAEAGVKHPHKCQDCPPLTTQPIANPNNYFGSTFDSGGIHRAIDVPNKVLIYQEIKNAIPAYNMQANYIAYLLCNTPFYGGLDDGDTGLGINGPNNNEVMLHETGGHILGGTGDEYVGALIEAWNATRILPVRWDSVYSGTPVVKIQNGQTWYVPTATCKMNTLNVPFCPVCAHQIELGTDKLIVKAGGTPPAGPVTPPVQPPTTGPDTSNKDGITIADPKYPTANEVMIQCKPTPNTNIYVIHLFESTGKTEVQHYQQANSPNTVVKFSGLTSKTTYLAQVVSIYPGTQGRSTPSTYFQFTTK